MVFPCYNNCLDYTELPSVVGSLYFKIHWICAPYGEPHDTETKHKTKRKEKKWEKKRNVKKKQE